MHRTFTDLHSQKNDTPWGSAPDPGIFARGMTLRSEQGLASAFLWENMMSGVSWETKRLCGALWPLEVAITRR